MVKKSELVCCKSCGRDTRSKDELCWWCRAGNPFAPRMKGATNCRDVRMIGGNPIEESDEDSSLKQDSRGCGGAIGEHSLSRPSISITEGEGCRKYLGPSVIPQSVKGIKAKQRRRK